MNIYPSVNGSPTSEGAQVQSLGVMLDFSLHSYTISLHKIHQQTLPSKNVQNASIFIISTTTSSSRLLSFFTWLIAITSFLSYLHLTLTPFFSGPHIMAIFTTLKLKSDMLLLCSGPCSSFSSHSKGNPKSI